MRRHHNSCEIIEDALRRVIAAPRIVCIASFMVLHVGGLGWGRGQNVSAPFFGRPNWQKPSNMSSDRDSPGGQNPSKCGKNAIQTAAPKKASKSVYPDLRFGEAFWYHVGSKIRIWGVVLEPIVLLICGIAFERPLAPIWKDFEIILGPIWESF